VALTLLVTQYNTKQQIEKLNKLKSDTYDEQSHLPTDLQQMRLEIISLKTEIDSLKN
jgi:septal ring factor EnvC (AmiA/AmiB activator)